jgi:ArsR family transcriptional regulator, virulence genes transcriptional regulator
MEKKDSNIELSGSIGGSLADADVTGIEAPAQGLQSKMGWTRMRKSSLAASNLLRALGSPHRLMILCLLKTGPRTVTEICEALGGNQSLISQHLNRLRLDGLVTVERRAQFAHYSLSNDVAGQIIEIVYEHFCRRQSAESASE